VSRTAAITSALLLAVLLAACGGGAGQRTPAPQPSPGALRVGVTLPVFADFVREVAGDRADVFSILPPGADPHTYEPTPSDIESIASADVIFVNNTEPGVEGSILDVIEANKGQDAKVVAFVPNVPSPGGENPHLWLDPQLARDYAGVVADTLAGEDQSNAAFYNGNLEDYGNRLSQLDGDIAAAVDLIPPEDRKLVTVHDAFPHFARRYGLEIAGFLVGGADEDPSPREIAGLTEAIEDEGVPAVFGEPQIGPETRLLEQIADDSGVAVCTLYSDTLDDRAPTYIDMMRSNADELLRCLGDQGG
jgi:zinc/manganese transport system substrate-binding protein/manganese/iron transport system substrate-binding protein